MLEKKKEEMRKRRKKRKDIDIINDNDDLIDALIARMKTMAEVGVSLDIIKLIPPLLKEGCSNTIKWNVLSVLGNVVQC